MGKRRRREVLSKYKKESGEMAIELIEFWKLSEGEEKF